ncbi:MAG: protein-methionine-sulfoxide reductase catalytic subunit MsrP [Actinobacteria bacterium]|nr:protein-methionine-sulfoxide reductase catalytic subunit MsrP [Actinomycetota bacterium]
MTKIDPSEITPESVYLSRRKFMVGVAALAGSALLAGCGIGGETGETGGSTGGSGTTAAPGGTPTPDELTSFDAITNYNNFYEFSLDKEEVASLAADFVIEPWTVEVGGMVESPRKYSIDELLALYPEEERVYRMRCVEGWSMVIPWLGFPLRLLLDDVKPTSEARYVRFQSLDDPERLPGQRHRFAWPYVEGLRLDEAIHDLTILSTGLYGKRLLPQNGAPIRLVVPWKYGFKSIKSVVRIDLVSEMPESLWMEAGPREYGFYANVNPEVDHPRWSQKTERRIGDFGRIDTLLFNGYDEVAPLYAGMDLRENY